MKKLIFLCALSACSQAIPDYQAPTLTSPADGSAFSRSVFFQWAQNNHANWTTGDYNFLLEISPNADFKGISHSFLTKLESHYDAPLYALKSGVYYWRVTATYIQNPTGEKTILASSVRKFIYDGNDGAIYVNVLASTSTGLGTKAQPVTSIGEAFYIANLRGLTSIILANGSYTESIPRLTGYTVKGCYDSSTWVRSIASCTTTISDMIALTYYDPLN